MSNDAWILLVGVLLGTMAGVPWMVAMASAQPRQMDYTRSGRPKTLHVIHVIREEPQRIEAQWRVMDEQPRQIQEVRQ